MAEALAAVAVLAVHVVALVVPSPRRARRRQADRYDELYLKTRDGR